MVGSYWFLALMVIASVLASVGGLLLVRRYASHQTLSGHHEVAGYMLSIIGTLYAIVLGLIVVNALNTFQQARTIVEQEADSLHDIFHIAHGMPQPASTRVRQLCLEYAQTVVEEEWEAMKVQQSSPRAHTLMRSLWQSAATFQPGSSQQSNLQQALLVELNQCSDCRQTRIMCARPVFDAIIWSVLIFGGVVLVVFTYFFGVEKFAVQMVMTVMVTLTLALNMALVVMFGYPYSGDVRVPADPFEFDLRTFEEELSDKCVPAKR